MSKNFSSINFNLKKMKVSLIYLTVQLTDSSSHNNVYKRSGRLVWVLFYLANPSIRKTELLPVRSNMPPWTKKIRWTFVLNRSPDARILIKHPYKALPVCKITHIFALATSRFNLVQAGLRFMHNLCPIPGGHILNKTS